MTSSGWPADPALHLLVLADDRTGALETAGICADAGWGPVPVVVGGPAPSDAAVAVVDLASRHLDRLGASRRITLADPGSARRVAHKIDSTLRGNWAAELVALQRFRGQRVVLVAAFPEVGRTCRNGVVLEHGRPVAEGAAGADARSGVWSSRPADHLRRAGAVDVTEVAGAEGLAAWLGSGSGRFAVCDARTDTDLEALAQVWSVTDDVLFAGTARSIGAAAAALRGALPALPPSTTRPPLATIRPPLSTPAMVVCGSLHPVARRQIAAIAGAPIAGRVTVLATPLPDVVPVSAEEARRASEALAERFHRLTTTLVSSPMSALATVVIIGGDTAAALLGDATVRVGGTVAAGVPWIRMDDGRLFVTRAGGFGTDTSLVELFTAGMDT